MICLVCLSLSLFLDYTHHSFETYIAFHTNTNPLGPTTTTAAPARIINFGTRISKRPREGLELPCKAVGIPSPSSVDWMIDQKKIHEVQSYFDEKELLVDAVLRISSLTLEHEGNYTCLAKNDQGQDSITFTLIIVTNDQDDLYSSHRLLPLPVLRVEETTSKSIRVRIIDSGIRSSSSSSSSEQTSSSSSSSGPLLQKIFFKNTQASSEWKHYVIEEGSLQGENGTFVLSNLLCGNQYQVYVTNLYRDGQTTTSEVLLTKTTGREPLAPPVSLLFSLSYFLCHVLLLMSIVFLSFFSLFLFPFPCHFFSHFLPLVFSVSFTCL